MTKHSIHFFYYSTIHTQTAALPHFFFCSSIKNTSIRYIILKHYIDNSYNDKIDDNKQWVKHDFNKYDYKWV